MLRMHKLALKAIARLARTDLRSASRIKRHNPILDSEIHIEEELINLKESVATLHTAGETLQQYPQMQKHMLDERESILKHCIGLVDRMLKGAKLPYAYTTEDIDHAIRRMVHILVDDYRATSRVIERDVMEVIRPYMSVGQRVRMRQWGTDLFIQAIRYSRMHRIGSQALKRLRLNTQ